MVCIFQKEMQIAVDHRKLGEPTGDTLLGKTVTLALSFSLFRLLQPRFRMQKNCCSEKV